MKGLDSIKHFMISATNALIIAKKEDEAATFIYILSLLILNSKNQEKLERSKKMFGYLFGITYDDYMKLNEKQIIEQKNNIVGDEKSIKKAMGITGLSGDENMVVPLSAAIIMSLITYNMIGSAISLMLCIAREETKGLNNYSYIMHVIRINGCYEQIKEYLLIHASFILDMEDTELFCENGLLITYTK